MKKIILSLMALMLSAGMATTLAGAEVSVSADVVSSYVWRGLDCGSVSLQPSLGIDCNGLSLGVWASTGLSDPSDTKEIDLVLSYETGGWNFSLVDYWFDEGPDCKNRFFKYAAHATNHVFEGNIGYDFGPLSLQWYTVFAGNDGVNEDGDRAYSSYVELSAPFRFASAEWTATAGFVPFATDYYGVSGFAVTDLTVSAAKEIKVSDTFSLPVFAQVTANPRTEKAYFVFGFTLQP